jgi:hypothetical protein
VVGATITPFKSSFIWTESRGRTWQEVNEWIRHSDAFDGVIDFAEVMAADGDPLTLAPAYDSGDGLHPGDAGTQAIADSMDLSVLGSSVGGCGRDTGERQREAAKASKSQRKSATGRVR